MVLAAIPLAWKMNRVKEQQRLVEALRKSGRSVRYDYEIEFDRQSAPTLQWPYNGKIEPTPPGPVWLRNLLGQDFLSDVVEVNMVPHSVDASQLDESQFYKEQTNLISLVAASPTVSVVSGLGLSDADLEHLATSRSLTKLTIGGSFTKAGFSLLRILPNLQELTLLSHPELTDEELVTILETLTTLKHLLLYRDTPISSDRLRRIKESLPGCEVGRGRGCLIL